MSLCWEVECAGNWLDASAGLSNALFYPCVVRIWDIRPFVSTSNDRQLKIFRGNRHGFEKVGMVLKRVHALSVVPMGTARRFVSSE